jgi:oligoribonuclease
MVWIDLEMTGLEPDLCHVIEVATIITDSELREVARGEDIVIWQSEEVLEGMNEWCKEHHGASGLTQQVRDSNIRQDEAEARVLEFIAAHVDRGQAPLCGNSVSLDRRFLELHMPSITDFLADTIVDVTTLKELVRRWYPDVGTYAKAGSHRALDDIVESIDELRWYRSHCLLDVARPAAPVASESPS